MHLTQQYTTDPSTSGRGIYLVLWAVSNETRPRPDGYHPATPDEGASRLVERAGEAGLRSASEPRLWRSEMFQRALGRWKNPRLGEANKLGEPRRIWTGGSTPN